MCLLVVVDVTLRSRVNGLGCLESNSDEVLTEDVVEDTGAEATVLLELLGKSVWVPVGPGYEDQLTISLTTSQA